MSNYFQLIDFILSEEFTKLDAALLNEALGLILNSVQYLVVQLG